MRHKLRLLRPVTERDGFGAEKIRYEATATVWAERRKLTGGLTMENGELFAGYSAEFNIRDAHEVDDHWRVEQLGGHLYTVESVIPNRERGMLTLRCERVNE